MTQCCRNIPSILFPDDIEGEIYGTECMSELCYAYVRS